MVSTPAHGTYHHMRAAWKVPRDEATKEAYRERLLAWRRDPTVVRIDRPTRLDRAHALGFKAKQGFVMARAKVRRGGLRKHMINKGRRPKRRAWAKITMGKSIQRIAEERTQKRFENLEVLNSYWVAEDGRHKYYEVILVDPHHAVIKADRSINWIGKPGHKNRVYRGKTSAGQRGRGLHKKGKGVVKNRPSIRANKRRGK